MVKKITTADTQKTDQSLLYSQLSEKTRRKIGWSWCFDWFKSDYYSLTVQPKLRTMNHYVHFGRHFKNYGVMKEPK